MQARIRWRTPRGSGRLPSLSKVMAIGRKLAITCDYHKPRPGPLTPPPASGSAESQPPFRAAEAAGGGDGVGPGLLLRAWVANKDLVELEL